ncbi:hypothetical protein Esti_002696 [Eimeria stiedai]
MGGRPSPPPRLRLLLLLLSLLQQQRSAAAAAAAGKGEEDQLSLSFPSLVSLYEISQGRPDIAFPLAAYNKAQSLFLLLQQRAQQQQQQQQNHEAAARLMLPEEQRGPTPSIPASVAQLKITEIPGYVLGGATSIHLACRIHTRSSSSSSEISALLCGGRPPLGQRSVDVSFGFQLPPTAAAAAGEELICKIELGAGQLTYGETHAFLKGALGLCVSLGYTSEVYVNQGFSPLAAVSALNPFAPASLGFIVFPARYEPYPLSAAAAAVNPNPWKDTEAMHPQAVKEEAAAADLLPSGPLSPLGWAGIPTDPGPHKEAFSVIEESISRATLSLGPSSQQKGDKCSFELGLSPRDFAAFAAAGANACKPGAPLLNCSEHLRQLPWTVERQRLSDLLLLQLQAFAPPAAANSSRMLHLLRQPAVWLLLQRLLGGPAAAKREGPLQRKWYKEEMQRISPHNYKLFPFNYLASSSSRSGGGIEVSEEEEEEEGASGSTTNSSVTTTISSSSSRQQLQQQKQLLESEMLRFASVFLDLLPTKTYWKSLRLGCLSEALGLAAATGSVLRRDSPQDLVLLKAAAAAAAGEDEGHTSSSSHHMLAEAAAGEPQQPQQQSRPSLLQAGQETEGSLDAYVKQHAAATAAAAQQLPSGLLLRPLQSEYYYKDLKALADATDTVSAAAAAGAAGDLLSASTSAAAAARAAAARQLWVGSPIFQGVPFKVLGVPARDGGSFDLTILCSTRGTFPITKTLVGWFSSYLCEPLYDIPNTTSSSSSGRRLTARLIGMEFEKEPPNRCGVSYLGNEEEHSETAVRGQVLLDLFLGLCWLHGFRAAWILDSVTDIYSKERMRYTMGVEAGQSFYEHKGFLFSIDTIKQRHRPEACLGFAPTNSSSSSSSNSVSGLCQVRRDLLQNPGFDPTVLYPLHARAFSTLQQLTFNCRAAAWQGCNPSSSDSSSGGALWEAGEEDMYPLLRQLEGGKCLFEKHPLWLELSTISPQACGFNQRVGACHAFVRKQLGCTYTRKAGCKYLHFLYNEFIFPGQDPEKKIPFVISKRWDRVGSNLARRLNLQPRELLLQLLQQELHTCSSSSSSGGRTLQQQMHRLSLTCEDLRTAGLTLQEMLEHALLFIDFSGLPQFWQQQQHRGQQQQEQQQQHHQQQQHKQRQRQEKQQQGVWRRHGGELMRDFFLVLFYSA